MASSPGFVDMIRGWWDDLEVWGPPRKIFHLKLKGIRDKLRIWNIEVFGDIERRKVGCLKIHKWDLKELEGLGEDSRIRKELRMEFNRILAMEEVI